MLPRTLAVAALLLAAAGCVTPGADTDATLPPVLDDPIIEAHDHSDPAQHALWTPSMEKLGFSALGEEPGATRGVYGEVDIHGDTAYVAVLGDGGETPGFLVVDISERASPKVVSFTPSPVTRVADVKGEPTNRWLFLGAERGAPDSPNRITRTVGDAQKGSEFTTRNGVRVYDVSDPEAPRMVAFAPSDSGCHMVFYKKYASGEWVFCVGTAIHIYRFEPAGPSLQLAARYQPFDPQTTAGLLQKEPTDPLEVVSSDIAPHDITVQEDELTGKVLMYASYWSLGLRIVDVTDPTSPKELGAWTGQGAKRYVGNIHTAMSMVTMDGKRYVYAIPELFEGASVPALFILDATDLAKPTLVGEWTAPGEHPNDGIRFSLHNFQIVHHKLYMAYYHGGVWVLDLHGEHAAAPETLGWYLPHEDVETTEPREEISIPSVWDVVLKDGYLYATDMNTGLYVLHLAGDALGDPSLTSTA